MKKITAILIILILFICSLGSAIADEFTIHSGITFGTKTEDVIEIEKAAGFKVEIDSNSIFKSSHNCVDVTGTIAGYQNATIGYIFNDNNELVEAVYYLISGTGKGVTRDEFSHLISVLTEKYGDSDEFAKTATEKNYLETSISDISFLNIDGVSTSITDCRAFCVKQNEDEVIIVFPFIVSVDMNPIAYYEIEFINYQIYTKQEYYEALQSISNDVVSILDDL